MAGASKALAKFYDSNYNAEERLSTVVTPFYNENADPDEILRKRTSYIKHDDSPVGRDGTVVDFDEPKIGMICAEAVLNVRSEPDREAPVLVQYPRRSEVYVVGRTVAGGEGWYKILDGDTVGYVLSEYVVFDEQKEEYLSFFERRIQYANLPEQFVPGDELDSLRKEDAEKFSYYAEQVNCGLKYDYPAQAAAGSQLDIYSVLVYIIENYQHIVDIADKYHLVRTYLLASIDMDSVAAVKERLLLNAGKTDDDCISEILAIQAEKARQDAERIAQEKAQAEYNYAVSIANYAASFIGILRYVWGGASLVDGADCSGFAAQVYAHFGLLDQGMANIHGYDSERLRSVGYAVNLKDIRPGDLVCYPGHVAIYFGDGVVVHAPSVGKRVSYGYLYMRNIITVRRLF